MNGLLLRNLRLFFSSKTRVFFSLLGALISFVLYLIFLRKMMIQTWNSFNGTVKLLDLWLMGGTLAVTAIITTGSALSMMVEDRENSRLADLILTDQSYTKIHLAYLFSAWLIGLIMQIAMYIVMQSYFMLADGLELDGTIILPVFLIMVFSSLIWSIFNMVLLSFVKNVNTVGHINTILGTASGFFAGVYIPIGNLPNFAKDLMKITPVPYNAALFRKVMVNDQLTKVFNGVPQKMVANFKQKMGLIISGNSTNDMKILLLSLIILSVLGIILYRSNKNMVVSKI
ncbi:ABC transporter permease [Companilactobacillus musae]|uniref:ABC transporter permease n=1 Tax=Companilactobacillus musae TaxID=1903258 RepID=UPI000E656DBD|nr:ABC transporter permease [Companilactobacillus musae]